MSERNSSMVNLTPEEIAFGLQEAFDSNSTPKYAKGAYCAVVYLIGYFGSLLETRGSGITAKEFSAMVELPVFPGE